MAGYASACPKDYPWMDALRRWYARIKAWWDAWRPRSGRSYRQAVDDLWRVRDHARYQQALLIEARSIIDGHEAALTTICKKIMPLVGPTVRVLRAGGDFDRETPDYFYVNLRMPKMVIPLAVGMRDIPDEHLRLLVDTHVRDAAKKWADRLYMEMRGAIHAGAEANASGEGESRSQ